MIDRARASLGLVLRHATDWTLLYFWPPLVFRRYDTGRKLLQLRGFAPRCLEITRGQRKFWISISGSLVSVRFPMLYVLSRLGLITHRHSIPRKSVCSSA